MPPMPPDFLQQLLARRDTWWGRESTGTGQGQSTGFNDLARILAGGGCGTLEGGRHMKYEMDTPFMNLGLTLLDKVGVHLDGISDSTGRLTEL